MTPAQVLVIGAPSVGPRAMAQPAQPDSGPWDAAIAAREVATGWRRGSPHVTTSTLAASNGGPGFVRTVSTVGATDSSPLFPLGSGSYCLSAGRACLEAAEFTAHAADSRGLGEAVRALIAQGHRDFVIGLGGCRTVDGGAGFLAGLAGIQAPGTPEDADPARTLPAARELVAGCRITGLYDDPRALLGFTGAAAAGEELLGWDKQTSQRAERRLGDLVAGLRPLTPPRTDLLSGKRIGPEREPGAGAGGGLGFALLALGGGLQPGPAWWAELVGLADRVRSADLVVLAEQVLDWRVLGDSVLEQVSAAAASATCPLVVLAEQVEIGRRELMSAGIAGSYETKPAAVSPFARSRSQADRTDQVGRRGSGDTGSALAALAARVSHTWTP